MCVAGGRLVRSSPQRPCDNVSGRDTALSEPNGNTPNLLYGPADQHRSVVRILFGCVASFAWWPITAIMANASMTSDTPAINPAMPATMIPERSVDADATPMMRLDVERRP